MAGKRHTLDALAEALIKEEVLERADVERNIRCRVQKNKNRALPKGK